MAELTLKEIQQLNDMAVEQYDQAHANKNVSTKDVLDYYNTRMYCLFALNNGRYLDKQNDEDE